MKILDSVKARWANLSEKAKIIITVFGTVAVLGLLGAAFS